jgi:hypothetical protein
MDLLGPVGEKAETRRKRIDWGCENLRAGKRRPCCWPGCPHRVKSSPADAAN